MISASSTCLRLRPAAAQRMLYVREMVASTLSQIRIFRDRCLDPQYHALSIIGAVPERNEPVQQTDFAQAFHSSSAGSASASDHTPPRLPRRRKRSSHRNRRRGVGFRAAS